MARHVGPQLPTKDSKSNPPAKGFEPLTKDSRSNPLTNCTILGHCQASVGTGQRVAPQSWQLEGRPASHHLLPPHVVGLRG
jgi:hypothetical protein